MKILNDNIRKQQRSAMIVSHNIKLALKNADLIYVLAKGEHDTHSTLTRDNIFRKDEAQEMVWKDMDNQPIIDIEKAIKNTMEHKPYR